MTKEEKIKEAYGKLGFDWNEINHLVTDNGVIVLPTPDLKYSLKGYTNLINDKDHFVSFGSSGLKLSPKSLEGLYNNNGWVKIESEDDLPKDKIDCFFINMEKRIYIGNYEYGFFMHGRLGHSTTTITHYQPIEKPKPPIY